MQLKVFLLFLIIPVISACERSFNISIPEWSDKPVLNLLMNKDSIMVARVTLSSRVGGSRDIKDMKDVVVSLYENGDFKETLNPYVQSGTTYYHSHTLAQAGADYRVSAVVPGYEEISGSDRVPDTVKTDGIKMVSTKVNAWQEKVTISLQLHDDPDVQNYYRFRMYEVRDWGVTDGDTVEVKYLQDFETGEIGIPILDDNKHTEFFTTDALFNGRSPVFNLRADLIPGFKMVILEVSSLTYHSYNYLNSLFLAGENNDDPLSEKVIVYNNIIKGLGIVGGVAQRQYFLVK
jgi:hypothetical protein